MWGLASMMVPRPPSRIRMPSGAASKRWRFLNSEIPCGSTIRPSCPAIVVSPRPVPMSPSFWHAVQLTRCTAIDNYECGIAIPWYTCLIGGTMAGRKLIGARLRHTHIGSLEHDQPHLLC